MIRQMSEGEIQSRINVWLSQALDDAGDNKYESSFNSLKSIICAVTFYVDGLSTNDLQVLLRDTITNHEHAIYNKLQNKVASKLIIDLSDDFIFRLSVGISDVISLPLDGFVKRVAMLAVSEKQRVCNAYVWISIFRFVCNELIKEKK